MITGGSGTGTKLFEQEEAERVAAELNEDYPDIDHEAEYQPERADDEADHQQVAAADTAKKCSRVEVGKLHIGLSSALFLSQHGEGQNEQRNNEINRA